MITTSAMMAAMAATSPDAPVTAQQITAMLGCNPVYLAIAIACGSQVGSWMNDSGFWIFSRMGGLTEVETLKTWTVQLSALGVVGVGLTLLAAWLVPIV